VGASRGSSSVNTTELVKHPVGGSCHSLLMLLGSSRLHTKTPSATPLIFKEPSLPFSLLRYILIINSSELTRYLLSTSQTSPL
jgi:hypothetical protein